MPQDTNPVQHMADTLAAHDRACRLLFDRIDHAFDLLHPAALPTSVLLALDYARGTAAELFPFLSGPFIQEPQAAAGPTQDQEPSRFTQHMAEALREYDNGFLTTGEMSAVLRAMLEDEETSQREDADLPDIPDALHLDTRDEHMDRMEQQATREAADNGEQPPTGFCAECGLPCEPNAYYHEACLNGDSEPPKPTVPGTPIPVLDEEDIVYYMPF